MKFEGFAAVNIKIAVFWDLTPYGLVEYWVWLGGTIAYTLPQMCLIFQVWLQFLGTGSLLDQGKMEYGSLTSTEMLCYVMLCYVMLCYFMRTTVSTVSTLDSDENEVPVIKVLIIWRGITRFTCSVRSFQRVRGCLMKQSLCAQ
jgi:hypothetical protein